MTFIPEEEYQKILKTMPVFCGDFLIFAEKKYLLIKRKEEPVKDVYWVIGGRLRFKETMAELAESFASVTQRLDEVHGPHNSLSKSFEIASCARPAPARLWLGYAGPWPCLTLPARPREVRVWAGPSQANRSHGFDTQGSSHQK